MGPVRIETRALDAAQSGGPQRFTRLLAVESRRFVHGDEPLRARAIDDWRLVTPAMHIAVLVIFRMKKSADLLDLGDDSCIGLPDVQPAEKRQRLCEAPVALNGGQDRVVSYAIGAATSRGQPVGRS